MVSITLTDKNGEMIYENIRVTYGNELNFRQPGTSEILFESDGNPVKLVFKDSKEEKGIWLNGFELME